LVAGLGAADGPLDLENLDPPGLSDELREATQAVLGVPVRGAGELQAFVVLGPAPGGGGYDTDDRDLLRAITHHAGVLLAHAGLADERQAAAELDALNRFSAFYLHDFKNLTARLSLVAQNAARHGDDPEFRASALKTVGRTAEQMNELIAKLAHRSPELGRMKTVDVGELVQSTVDSLGPDFGAVVESGPPGVVPVLAVREQLQQVVLNLVLNARKALDGGLSQGAVKEPVRVRLGVEGERALLEVVDEGPGIAPENLRTLFQPFRSTTRDGFGIGLYESKRIVESYGGRLRIVTALGKGTRVMVELPTVAPETAVGQTAAAEEGQHS
jgi:putative PEP-CTERM system histidine kinase